MYIVVPAFIVSLPARTGKRWSKLYSQVALLLKLTRCLCTLLQHCAADRRSVDVCDSWLAFCHEKNAWLVMLTANHRSVENTHVRFITVKRFIVFKWIYIVYFCVCLSYFVLRLSPFHDRCTLNECLLYSGPYCIYTWCEARVSPFTCAVDNCTLGEGGNGGCLYNTESFSLVSILSRLVSKHSVWWPNALVWSTTWHLVSKCSV